MSTNKKEKSDVGLQVSIFDLGASLAIAEKYKDIVSNIKESIDNVFNEYGNVGQKLCEAQELKLYEFNDYKNIFEFARAEFDLSETTTRNVMTMYQRFFDKGGYSPRLLEKYQGFTYSALVELLSVPDNQIDEFVPSMTVKEIRNQKLENDINKKVKALTGKDGFITSLKIQIENYDFASSYDRDDTKVIVELAKKDFELSEDYHWNDKIASLTARVEFSTLPKISFDFDIYITKNGELRSRANSTKGYVYLSDGYLINESEITLIKYLDQFVQKTKQLLPSTDANSKSINTFTGNQYQSIKSLINNWNKESFYALYGEVIQSINSDLYFESTSSRLTVFKESKKSKKNKPMFEINNYHDPLIATITLNKSDGSEDTLVVYPDVKTYLDNQLKQLLKSLEASEKDISTEKEDE